MTTSPTGNEHRRCGFTLVELTLVAVIVAVLATAAAPGLQRAAQRLQVERTAADLAHILRAAHERAVADAQPTLWRWDHDARRARVRSGTEPEEDGPVLFESGSVPAAIAVQLAREGAPVDCACVRFFPDSTSEGGRLTLDASDDAYDITIDAATSYVALTARAAAR